MRLTLRTLLSLRDGMLPPDVGRDLAARVEASADARALAARIDDVVARPTLSAPPPDAAGFAAAANTTAEYLDNVLPPERLGEFERVCFASEAQLAEAAATHEILAEFSRASAGPLDAAASRRLLAAARARSGDEPRDPVAVAPERPPKLDTVRAAAAAPSRSARPPASAWMLVVAALLLLAALVGVLGWSLARVGRARGSVRDAVARKAAPAIPVRAPTQAPPSTPEPAAPPPAAPAPGVEVNAPVAVPPVARVAPEAQEPPSTVVAADAPPDVAPTPGGDEPAAAAPVAGIGPEPSDTGPPSPAPATPQAAPPVATMDQRVPQGDALAIAAPAVAIPPVAAPPPAVTAAAAPAAAPAALVSGSEIVLFRSAADRGEAWLAGAEQTALDLPADLAAPPFCRPALSVDDMRIVLEPGTRAVLARDAAGVPHLEVVFGAAIIAGPGRLGLVAGELAGAITTGPAAPVGVEVALRRPPGAGADATQRVARIMPTAGRIAWQPAVPAAGEREIAAGQALEWRSDTAGEPLVVDAGPPADWLVGGRADADVERRAADALARRLAAGTAALPGLRELAVHRRVENRLAAAAALALLGEFDELARLLVADGGAALPESLWNRLDAVAVQPALARGARAAEGLAAAVAAHAPPGAADAVIRLARGTSDDDLAAGAAAELVAALESPHLVVRRYALRNLVEVVGATPTDRLRYRADRPPADLRAGAAWWRTQAEQGRIRRTASEGGVDR